ncbi:GlsB/YeaQ/YmgE family stress response membrane protein [Primorskyibacter sp. 2E107]|uniref:GlsB/YeaQ/YmgE family stress response membrane protein n=1 Tax=Primorskyibacter sp. 2E107 TaxID=3403458 RepID=UPI003AF43F74
MGLGFFLSIIIGGLAGWIGSRIMKADTGLLLNIALGIIGAIVLNFVLARAGIYAERAVLPQLLVGAAGASMLIWVTRQLRG